MKEILFHVIQNKTLEKIVLSKSVNKEILKAKCRLVEIKGKVCLQIETFYSDNKVFQKNVDVDIATNEIESLFTTTFRQMNVFSTSGNAEIKFSKKGKLLISDNIKRNFTNKVKIVHNNEKQYILSNNSPIDFLVELGVQDKTGRVYDKKTSKFRQINRFLEFIKDIENQIIDGEKLYIIDLCCGKSYLSFAVYYYFSKIKNLKVEMDCVDLKKDVIDFCNSVCQKLNYTGLNFIHGDVNLFTPRKTPNLTVSLHACDVATDIVLLKGIESNSKVIMSTPCCHHELNGQLKKANKSIDVLLQHSILKQKLSDALTDSLRCKALEIKGYSVNAVELIDPEETPKNVLIRAVKKPTINQEEIEKYKKEYIDTCELFSVKPYMYDKIIK